MPRPGIGLRASLLLGALFAAGLIGPRAALAVAPVNTVPGTQNMDEDTTLTFSIGDGNPISVADADTANLEITLSGNFGKLTLSGTANLNFSAGDGTSDMTMTFTGAIADINNALEGLQLTPDAHFVGTATLTIKSDDGATSDEDVVTIDVAPVQDAPVNFVPSGLGTYKDVARVLSAANLNAVSIEDVDGAAINMQVGLSASGGTLTLANTASLTSVVGNGSGALTIQGTRGNINGAFGQGLTFTPDAGFTGQATITVDSDDLGNTGSGGPMSDTDVFSIEVDPIGDAIYWNAAKNTLAGQSGALARAALDGSGGANLITGPELQDTAAGIAIDAVEGRIYWANTGAFGATPGIWSANLDGSDKQLFVDASSEPAGTLLSAASGLVIDQETRRLYWANGPNTGAAMADKSISYVSLDDPSSGGSVFTGTGTVFGVPRGLVLDLENDRVYWTSAFNPQGIYFAPLPGASGISGKFTISGASTSSTSGVALDPDTDRLFWTNGQGNPTEERLRVATLNPPGSANETAITGSIVSISPLTGSTPRATAIDKTANRIYWGSRTDPGKVQHANLDGTGGGADLTTAPAFTFNPDGMAILKHPAPAGAPAISGTPTVGSTLTCGDAVWAPDEPGASLYRVPASTAVAWTRDGAPIAGATNPTHVPAAAGEYKCSQTATNFAGSSTQESAAVAVSAPPALPAAPTGTSTLAVGTTRAAVSSSGAVEIPVECTGTADCTGTVGLTTARRLVARAGAARTYPAGTAIGSTSFAVAAGTRGTVSVPLNAAGRRIASRRASIPAQATTTLTGGLPSTTSLTLTSSRAPAISPRSRAATVRAGRAAVRLRCGAAAGRTCRGTLTLTARLGRRTTTIARRAVRLRGARTARVTLKLSAAARRALRRGPLAARQAIESTVAVGLDTRRRGSLRLTR